MKTMHCYRPWIAAVTCLALVGSSLAQTATPGPADHAVPIPAISDVRLSVDGALHGQLLSRQGQPLTRTPVTLSSSAGRPAQTTTDEQGRFRFSAVRGGLYAVGTDSVSVLCRVWTVSSAPPSARPQLLLVDGAAVRGQQAGWAGYRPAHRPLPSMPGIGGGLYDGMLFRTLSSPWVMAGGVAAGVAIPLALANNDKEGS